jgi:hypothetical protein
MRLPLSLGGVNSDGRNRNSAGRRHGSIPASGANKLGCKARATDSLDGIDRAGFGEERNSRIGSCRNTGSRSRHRGEPG